MYKLCHIYLMIWNCLTIYYNFLKNNYIACYLKETGFHNIDIHIHYDLKHDKFLKDCLNG